MQPWFSTLADGVLVLHALLVLFNVGALPVIWIGYFRRWRWVRNPYFRFAHLLLIGMVAAESIFGVVCPLTSWEEALRAQSGKNSMHPGGFVAHWLHRLLFYDFPAWVFTAAYLLFFVAVLLTFYIVRPDFPARRKPA
jgi:hypothetical protein